MYVKQKGGLGMDKDDGATDANKIYLLWER